MLEEAEARKRIKAPEDAEIKELCDRLGYGAVMDSASRMWRKKLIKDGYPEEGAFVVGVCLGTLQSVVRPPRTDK